MAILTPEQIQSVLKKNQEEYPSSGGIIQGPIQPKTGQVSGLNQTHAITQPVASGSVLKASDIKPQSQLQINELTGKEPDTSLVFSDLAGMKVGADLMEKKIAEDQKRIEEGKKQESSWLSKITGSKTPEEVAQDTASEIGFSPSEYLTQRKTDIAEMESLQTQYQALTEQRDNELLGLEQNAGFSKSYLNKEMTYAEKKWNLRLNAQAGIINTKAAIMKLKDENYTMANQYINQAVTNATADKKLQYDQYDKLRQDNKDLFDDLGEDFKTIYATSEKKALMDYESVQNEKTQIGKMMTDYPDAPWTANSMSLSLGEAAQIAAQSQKYQLEKQQQQASIYKAYDTGTTSTPSSYQEWTLAGGLEGTGKTYAEFISGKSGSGLTAGQKDDLATMETIKMMGQEVLDLGTEIGWKGTGGFGQGSISQFLAKNVGIGKEKEQELRNKISNIKSTLAKLRGGTALSVQEMQMLDAYVPTINDSPLVIESKIKSFTSYIDQKKNALISISGGNINSSNSSGTTLMTGTDGSQWNVPNDKVELFKKNGYK